MSEVNRSHSPDATMGTFQCRVITQLGILIVRLCLFDSETRVHTLR